MSDRLALWCSPWLALLLASAHLRAQAAVPVDPYTRGDAAAMQRAGYVSFGPFPFGDGHSTGDVEMLLGDEPLCWVETAHFRIGCALSSFSVSRGDAEWRRGLRRELKRLRQRIPRVKTVGRKLDPWLRTHLIAQRLEDCYAEIQRDLGVTDDDFPDQAMDPAGPPAEYAGLGPYLGMAQKFSVLLVKRSASCARYTRAYGGQESLHPMRLYFRDCGTWGLCIAEETNSRQLEHDQALHAHLIYNVVANLLNGYRSYGHDLPPWLLVGLAHWHSRRVSPKFPVYERAIKNERVDSPFWHWDERALGLMRFDAFEPLDQLIRRRNATEFEMEQHIQAWFFVDYLMHARKRQTMALLHRIKDPFHQKLDRPSHEELMQRQAECFEALFEIAPAELDAEWRRRARRLQHRRK